MNILVTGANGQLGNEMQVLARENLQHTYFFTDVQELDICDEQAVYAYVSEHKIDIIVNCAAYTAVDKAEDNVELCDKLNNIAPGYLARAAQANGAAMIQVSTDYVFDGTAHIPYTEEEPTCPASVYGSTKLAGEQNVMDHCEKAMVIRTAWLYSIYGNNFVKTMILWESFSIRSVHRLTLMIWPRLFLQRSIKALSAAFTISVTKVFVPGMTLP